MNIFRLVLLLFTYLSPRIVEGEGGEVIESPPDGVGTEQPAHQDVQTDKPPEKPSSMLDAISQSLDREIDPATGQPRDERGRFATKAADPQKPPVQPTKAEEDPLQMPEGLGAKAQERFQKLANTNKELVGQVEQLSEQVNYVRDTFQQHGIQREQFEQAASVIGMMNRGDLEGALKVLDEQRKLIAIAMGKPIAGTDALADFPQLRNAVDEGRLDEESALELARARMREQAINSRAQRQNEQAQSEQAQEHAFTDGQRAIDAFCKKMEATDVDFPRIEEMLLPEIQNILRGVPPNQWAQAVETQYRLIKKAAGTRQSNGSTGPVLRPTGQGAPGTAPKSMYEAMWGSRA